MQRKAKTSITFDVELWKKFKKKCIDENQRYVDVLEELMKKWIK